MPTCGVDTIPTQRVPQKILQDPLGIMFSILRVPRPNQPLSTPWTTTGWWGASARRRIPTLSGCGSVREHLRDVNVGSGSSWRPTQHLTSMPCLCKQLLLEDIEYLNTEIIPYYRWSPWWIELRLTARQFCCSLVLFSEIYIGMH